MPLPSICYKNSISERFNDSVPNVQFHSKNPDVQFNLLADSLLYASHVSESFQRFSVWFTYKSGVRVKSRVGPRSTDTLRCCCCCRVGLLYIQFVFMKRSSFFLFVMMPCFVCECTAYTLRTIYSCCVLESIITKILDLSTESKNPCIPYSKEK